MGYKEDGGGRVKVGSLFSGIGGLELGFERVGFETAWQVENHKPSIDILKRHWPFVKRWEDVKTFDPKDFESVDLVAGGFPCQDLSVSGKMAGLAGERSGLFFQLVRVVAQITPRWVVLENVPGLLSSNEGRDLAAVFGELERLGYWWAWRVLDAKGFGVAQRRRRVFVVASLGDPACWQVLFGEGEGGGDIEMDEEARHVPCLVAAYPFLSKGGSPHVVEMAAPCLTASYSADGYGAGRPYLVDGGFVWTGLKSCGGSKGRTPDLNCGLDENYSMPDAGDTDCIGENTKQMLRGLAGKSLFSLIHASGTDAPNISNPLKATKPFGEKKSDETDSGTKKPSSIIKTLDGRFIDCGNARLRALTPTEFEKLQGFPAGWTEGITDKERYKAVGNSIVPQVAEWLGKRIMEVANF